MKQKSGILQDALRNTGTLLTVFTVMTRNQSIYIITL